MNGGDALCSWCQSEIGAFECWDGRLIGFACIRTALREADRQLADAFGEHWQRLYRRDEP